VLYVAFTVVLSCDISIFIGSTYMCLSDGSRCGNNNQFVLIHVICTPANRLFRGKIWKKRVSLHYPVPEKVWIYWLLIAGRKLKLITKCYILFVYHRELLPQKKLVSLKANMNQWMHQQLSTSNCEGLWVCRHELEL